MQNIHQKLFVSFVIALLFLPLTRFFGVKDRSPLNIVEFTGDAPSLFKQSFKKRTFQKNFEDYWNLSFGQRRRAIVVQHALYEIFNFGQFHAGYRKTLPEAHGGGLLEKIELDVMFDRACPFKREIYKNRLIAIKNNLAAKGVPFFVILFCLPFS